ncbi:hypothetical protein ACFQVD_39985 [Streptosporangium amethystogenes subsp. fukuiense]|uniref:Outer membrane channel protein CpnT-like N-terminal domain-containing protein n=1 Tax=Streptosporangium amethystogenes subsp. fukuiense TaxID=698418 RepID=A0ABW2TD72_9ACTN
MDRHLEALVPPIVRPYVGWIVGMDWPKGDEEGCFRLSDAYREIAATITALIEDGNTTCRDIRMYMDGSASDAFEEYWKTFTTTEPFILPRLKEACEKAGKQLNAVGLEIEYAKYMILLSLFLLAAQITYFVYLAAPSFGRSLSLIPMACRLTQMTVRQIAMRLLRNIALFGGVMVGMDGLIQTVQVAGGRREDWDWMKTGMSLAGGALAGLAFTGFGVAISKLGGSRIASETVERIAMTWREKAAALLDQSALGMATQSMTANTFASMPMLAASGQLSWETLAKSASAGFLGGADGHLIAPTGHQGANPLAPLTGRFPENGILTSLGDRHGAGGDTPLATALAGNDPIAGAPRQSDAAAGPLPHPDAADSTAGGSTLQGIARPDPVPPADRPGPPQGRQAHDETGMTARPPGGTEVQAAPAVRPKTQADIPTTAHPNAARPDTPTTAHPNAARPDTPTTAHPNAARPDTLVAARPETPSPAGERPGPSYIDRMLNPDSPSGPPKVATHLAGDPLASAKPHEAPAPAPRDAAPPRDPAASGAVPPRGPGDGAPPPADPPRSSGSGHGVPPDDKTAQLRPREDDKTADLRPREDDKTAGLRPRDDDASAARGADGPHRDGDGPASPRVAELLTELTAAREQEPRVPPWLNRGIHSGIAGEPVLLGGKTGGADGVRATWSVLVEKWTFNDGSHMIRKVLATSQEADAEVLAAIVGTSLGADVPGVYRADDRVVYQEFKEGQHRAALPDEEVPTRPELTRSGMRVSLLDVLITNPDRHSFNWFLSSDPELRSPTGQRLGVIGIDHNLSFEDPKFWAPKGEFGTQFVRGELTPDGARQIYVGRPNPLSPEDVQGIKRVLKDPKMRSEFERRGRLDWYNNMLSQLNMIERNAVGTEPRMPMPVRVVPKVITRPERNPLSWEE